MRQLILLLVLPVACIRAGFVAEDAQPVTLDDVRQADLQADANRGDVAPDIPAGDSLVNTADTIEAGSWPVHLQSSVGGYVVVRGLVIDGTGSVHVAGAFDGALTVAGKTFAEGGKIAGFVVGLDGRGGHRYTSPYIPTGGQRVVDFRDLALAADRLVLAGIYGGQGEVTIHEGTGTRSEAINSGARQDVLLLLHDLDGRALGVKVYDGFAANAQGRGAAAYLPTGRVAMAGLYGDRVDLGNGPLVAAGNDDNDNGFAMSAGSDLQTSWSKPHVSPGIVQGNGVAFASGGQLGVVGSFTGSLDVGRGSVASRGGYDGYLAVHDSSGAALWHWTVGSAGLDWLTNVRALPAGGWLVSGIAAGDLTTSDGTTALGKGATDGFVAYIDAGGKTSWLVTVGGAGDDSVDAVALGQSGRLFIGGSYSGDVQLESTALPTAEGRDAYVARLSSLGEVDWAVRAAESSGDEFIRGIGPNGTQIIVSLSFNAPIRTTGGNLVPQGTDVALVSLPAP